MEPVRIILVVLSHLLYSVFLATIDSGETQFHRKFRPFSDKFENKVSTNDRFNNIFELFMTNDARLHSETIVINAFSICLGSIEGFARCAVSSL